MALGQGAIGQFAIGQGPSGLNAEPISVDKWFVPFADLLRKELRKGIRRSLQVDYFGFKTLPITVQIVAIEQSDIAAFYEKVGISKRAIVSIIEIKANNLADVVIREIKYSRGYS